jgi:hypothetical protein
MNAVALSGNANKSDANNFNAGIFKELSSSSLLQLMLAQKTSGLRPTKS